MRGAERPRQVQWTHPFLSPLAPLPLIAAKQTFIDIADDIGNEEEVKQLLALTDYLPLAITLIANVVAYEGCQSVLNRWKTETTSILSLGPDRTSSLEKSIMISLSSSRMTSVPDALQLLSLLSILPDGLSDADMKESQVPLDISTSKITLLRTSLAYISHDHKLKVLMPIQEYIQAMIPPDKSLIVPLYKFFYSLIDLFEDFGEYSSQATIKRLSGNINNISSVLQLGFKVPYTDMKTIVHCICKFAHLSWQIQSIACYNLLHLVSPHIASLHDLALHGQYLYILAITNSKWESHKDHLSNAMKLFKASNNLKGQGLLLFFSLYIYYILIYIVRVFDRIAIVDLYAGDISSALDHSQIAITLAKQTCDLSLQSLTLYTLSSIQHYEGNYHLAILAAHQSLLLAKDSGNLDREAGALLQQSRTYIELGNFQKASALLVEAQTLFSAIGFLPSSVPQQHVMNSDVLGRASSPEARQARPIQARPSPAQRRA